MSTSFTDLPPRPELPATSFLKMIVQAWNRFWFAPGDPIVLGLVRLCCGMMAFYTIFTYTWDLQELFGKDAWYSLQFRRELEHDQPRNTKPLLFSEEEWPNKNKRELLKALNLNDVQYKEISAAFAKNSVPDDTILVGKLTVNEDQLRKLHYVAKYIWRWKQFPPAPFPKDDAEAERINKYLERWNSDPRMNYDQGTWDWSIWYHVTDPRAMAIIHGAFMLATFFLAIGFCTRISSVIAWFAALCYINRSPVTLFGVDTMMLIMLTYLMIGPSGAALSVDRLISRWWRWRQGELPDDMDDRPRPSVSANFATRMLQVHVCFIYAAAGLSKLKGNTWWNGSAIWGTLANAEFAPMNSPIYMYLLRLLVDNYLLLQVFLAAGTYFTLFFEIGYAFLIWGKYTRWLMLSMALMLHGVIGTLMGLKTFALMMLIMNGVFLPPQTVHWMVGLFRRWGRGIAGTAPPTKPHVVGAKSAKPELAVAGPTDTGTKNAPKLR
jgi:hypothetical protein